MRVKKRLGVVTGVVLFAPAAVAMAHGRGQPPAACEPRADGRGCARAECGDDDSQCRPTAARCDASGACRAESCDCQEPKGCRVRIDDDGRAKCGGQCEEGSDCREVRKPLDNGETLLTCECEKRVCEPRSDGRSCRRAGCGEEDGGCKALSVECDAAGACRVSECDCQKKSSCHVRLGDEGQPKCGGRCDAGNDCEMNREPLDNGGTRITCGCVTRECEPRSDGRKCKKAPCAGENERCSPSEARCDAEGHCRVDACDCQDRKACRMRLPKEGSNEEPRCAGGCDSGSPCEMTREHLDSGEVLFRCECGQNPLDCAPNEGASACNGAACANDDERCRASTVVCDASGACRVEACDCGDKNGCGVELSENGDAACRGGCAFGGACQAVRTPLPGGGVMVECACSFAACGKPDSSGLRCSNLPCDEDGSRCSATSATCDANGACRVQECDCQGSSLCRVLIDSSTRRASCDGACPDGLECVESRTPQPNGGELVTCDCVEP